jgi:hypothetical protein
MLHYSAFDNRTIFFKRRRIGPRPTGHGACRKLKQRLEDVGLGTGLSSLLDRTRGIPCFVSILDDPVAGGLPRFVESIRKYVYVYNCLADGFAAPGHMLLPLAIAKCPLPTQSFSFKLLSKQRLV